MTEQERNVCRSIIKGNKLSIFSLIKWIPHTGFPQFAHLREVEGYLNVILHEVAVLFRIDNPDIEEITRSLMDYSLSQCITCSTVIGQNKLLEKLAWQGIEKLDIMRGS